MLLHSINSAQRLYVMPCGDGYSCYGFDVLDRKARAIAAWLAGHPRYTGRPVPQIQAESGTPEHFAACADMFERAESIHRMTGDRCPADLVPALIGLEGRRVECAVYGERRRFQVGKSTGWLPAHLMVHNRRSHGGYAISADAITGPVRIVR